MIEIDDETPDHLSLDSGSTRQFFFYPTIRRESPVILKPFATHWMCDIISLAFQRYPERIARANCEWLWLRLNRENSSSSSARAHAFLCSSSRRHAGNLSFNVLFSASETGLLRRRFPLIAQHARGVDTPPEGWASTRKQRASACCWHLVNLLVCFGNNAATMAGFYLDRPHPKL